MDNNRLSRILGIDFGGRRIGLALSDPLGIIAKPFMTIDLRINPNYIDQILEVTDKNDINKVVVGVPLTLKGTFSLQTKTVQNFIKELSSAIKIPIIELDERLSSVAAKRSLKEQGVKTGYEKGRVDETAAAIILQEYLDSES